MDDPYAEIAQRLHRACPPEYSRAWISGEVSADYTDLEFGYHLQDEKDQWLIPELSSRNKIRDALRAIQSEMTLPDAEPWSKCTFTLFSDGQFKFDVAYDD